ncbi:MAG: AbrB/MazE/SpoVT family DNA-binding domain-containing protein [Candidatus Bathyarchaeia archaeon]
MTNKLELVKMFSGGKVTVPRSIRKMLRLRDGDYLAVTVDKVKAEIVYFPVSIKPARPQPDA